MLCPWCFHYGSEDDEYLFDEELYCGICAQQMPRDPARWLEAFHALDPEMIGHIEDELNRIAVSKSGLQRDLLDAMGSGLMALAELRASGTMTQPESEYAR